MELLQLKYFCHAAATESFAKTAQEFYVPSSTISISIKRLETELGTPLFTRTANRVKLNPQGQFYYNGIRQALDLIEETTRTLSEGSHAEKIRVGIRLGRRSVLRGINLFREQYPEVEVIHSKFGPDSLLEDFDIVTTDDSLENENYTKANVLHDRIMLVAAKGLLPEGELSREFLQGLTFVSLPQDSVMYRTTTEICRDLGLQPKILTPTEKSVYFVPRCVEEGIGVALTYPKAQWVFFMADQLDMRHIGEYYHDICIYCRKKNAPPHISQLHEVLLSLYPQRGS